MKARLSRARVVVSPHLDVRAVEAALSARNEERALVVTDSVFSTDGALAPLRELHEVCRAHRALLLVDEHGSQDLPHASKRLLARQLIADIARRLSA